MAFPQDLPVIRSGVNGLRGVLVARVPAIAATFGVFITCAGPATADCTKAGSRTTCTGSTMRMDAPLAEITDSGSFINTGNASVGGATGYAVIGVGNGTKLTNEGTLTTDGNSIDALEALGDEHLLLNLGRISTGGISADAMRAVGHSNHLINKGEVVTGLGSSARGLFVEGNANTLTNDGRIVTGGAGSEGMSAYGDGNTLTNMRSIATSGSVANGMRAHGNRNTVVNDGTITTQGLEARGIKVDAGANNAIVNRGGITTEKERAYGIWVSSKVGDITTILNEAGGTIVARQERALYAEGGDESVQNFGLLSNLSGGAAADLGDGKDRFLIGATSVINGFVDGGSGIDTFALGGETNARFDAALIRPNAQYRNFETYEKVGSSIWTVGGINNRAMPWDIREGALMATGSMGGSDMVVHSGATLGGTGTLGSIDARSGSILTPGIGGIGSLHVNGNVLIADGTIYRIDLTPHLRSDRIVAQGSATVRGGTVDVSALPGDYKPGSRWTILTAMGGVSGQFSRVVTDLAFFKPILTKDGRNIYLELPQIRPSTLPADRPVIDPFLPVTEDELPDVLNQTSGEPIVSATGIMLANDEQFRAAILCRLRCSAGAPPELATFAALDGVPVEHTADMPRRSASPIVPVAVPQRSDWAVWGKAIGSWGSTGATATSAAVDRRTGGVVFGIDSGLGTPYRVGLAAGYFSTKFDIGALNASGNVESVQVGLYGSAAFGAFNLRGGVAYGHHEVDLARSVAFTGFAGNNRSNSAAQSFQAFGELGYGIVFDRVMIEPFVGLAYMHIGSRGVFEEGSAVSVAGDVHSFDTTYSTLGARMVASFPTSAGMLTFKGLIGWRHAFGDIVPKADFSYASGSSPFLVSGAPIDKDSLVVEAGLNWEVSKQATLSVAYSGALGRRDQEHTVRAGLSVRF